MRHCNYRSRTDPVSGFKGTVEPFGHLLVGTELPGDRIIVCEPDYLRDVKLEAFPQLLSELQGGQRIGAVPIGNEPELLRSFVRPWNAMRMARMQGPTDRLSETWYPRMEREASMMNQM